MATSHIKNYFGKTIEEEITAHDVIQFFSIERQETTTLEFKSYNPRNNSVLNNIFRAIAAFLNSEGGLLIFGAPTEIRKEGNYKVAKGDPTSIPTTVTTKDRLMDSILGNISYIPVGIRIYDILMANGEFVYLIEVPESVTKPHQHDNVYPIRLDGKTIPAPHYLVEMMFNQVKRPELKGFLRVTSYKKYTSNYDPFNKIDLGLEATIVNTRNISDTDIYIQLVSELGLFTTRQDIPYRFENAGSTIIINNIAMLLTESLIVKRSFLLTIRTDHLRELDGSFSIQLIFGGKSSIPKCSTYSIQQKDINLTGSEFGQNFTLDRDLNNLLFIKKDENNLYTNISQEGDESERYGLKGI